MGSAVSQRSSPYPLLPSTTLNLSPSPHRVLLAKMEKLELREPLALL